MKIEKIEIKNLHHRFDIDLNSLSPGLNVVHAENGAGKTTVLHIIANLLSGNLDRFFYLDFDLISIWFSGQVNPISIHTEKIPNGSRLYFKLPDGEYALTKTSEKITEQAIVDAKGRSIPPGCCG